MMKNVRFLRLWPVFVFVGLAGMWFSFFTLFFCCFCGCAGAEFTGSPIFEPDWPDARALDAATHDAKDAGAELERVADAGDSGDAGEAEASACDLTPCQCGAHVALCCEGPCPSGFEGLSCYCGDCRFPKTYDAGLCF